MKIYVGNSKAKAKETTIGRVLNHFLDKAKIQSKLSKFSDDSAAWVDIIQLTQDGSAQITVNIGLTGDLKEITDVGVWKAKRIYDEENAKKII